MGFDDFNLNTNLLKAVKEQGFTDPTDIQSAAIPILLNGDVDFVGQAQTGTGKTAAFVLPLLQKLDPSSKHIQALILTPTRELTYQIREEISKLGKYSNLTSLAIFGGSSYIQQIRGLKKDKPQIIVGTPGRVIDLMEQGILRFNRAEFVVLDEADEMLNMGFLEDVQKILSSFENNKKMWMYAATMPPPILNLIKKEFRNPEIINIKKKTLSNEDIEQRYYVVKEKYHREALCRILDSEPSMYGIVFCRTRLETRDLADALLSRGYNIETLHGEMGQAQRNVSMARFKKSKTGLMICTDVAARGIDVNNLTHVINYGLPQDLESYVHRIGRTGRAGMKGVAISILDPKSLYRIRRIENFIRKKIDHCRLPSVKDLKSSLVCSEVKNLSPVIGAIVEKGDDFKLDETFKIFNENLENFSKHELLKIMFTWKFKQKLRRYDDMSVIDEAPKSREPRFKENNFNRKNLNNKNNRNNRNNSNRRRTHESDVGNKRLFLNMGKGDGLNLNFLLNDLARQTGLRRNQIRNVYMKDRFSFLEVPLQHADKILQRKDLMINNRKVRLEYSQ